MSNTILRRVVAGGATILLVAACAEMSPTGPDDSRMQALALMPTSAACAEMPITSDPFGQTAPAVSGNLIVWTDERNGGSDIYGYDLTAGQESQLTFGLPVQFDPAVAGNTLVWAEFRRGNGDVGTLDLSSGQQNYITLTPARVEQPAISGNVIVWMDFRDFNWDIYGFDLTSAREFRITDEPTTEDSPAISGDIVVWADHSGAGDIYALNLSTGKETLITPHGAGQVEPAVYGNIIVWTDYRNGAGDIYAHDLSNGRETRLTIDPADEGRPAIYGNTVVFVRRDPFGRGDIIALDLATGVEMPITQDASDQNSPVIAGGVVAWADDRDGNYDIYALVCSTSTSDPVQSLGDLIEQVESLGPDGSATINTGQTNALTRKLAQALRLLDHGQTGEALDVLLDFRRQVLDLEAEGVLSASESMELLDAVDAIVASLSSA